MVAPKIRIKRPAAVAEPAVAEAELPEPDDMPDMEPDEAEELDEAEVEEEATSPYDELSVEDLRTELNARGLDSTGRRSVLQERLEADDAKPKPKAAPKPVAKPVVKTVQPPAPKAAPAPAAKPVAKPVAAPAKAAVPANDKVAPASKPVAVAPKAAPQPIPAKPVASLDADDATKATLSASFKEVLEAMSTGMSLVIAHTGKNEWEMTLMSGDAVAPAKAAAAADAKKLRGDEFWREVLSPEYYSWYYEDAGTGKPWSQMTSEEKAAFVEATGVQYAASEDARVNALHQVEALLTQLGIEKYKPEYKSAKARDALKA